MNHAFGAREERFQLLLVGLLDLLRVHELEELADFLVEGLRVFNTVCVRFSCLNPSEALLLRKAPSLDVSAA